MVRRAPHGALVALVLASSGLAACGDPAADASGIDPQADIAGVTFRVWDENAAAAYRESFDAFNATYPEIHVEVEVVPRESYETRMDSDLTSGTMADIFWTTTSGLARQADAGRLVNVSTELDVDAWEQEVVDHYSHDGQVWAVPQLWDPTVLYYNADLVAQAGVDPSALTWVPTPAAPVADTGGADGVDEADGGEGVDGADGADGGDAPGGTVVGAEAGDHADAAGATAGSTEAGASADTAGVTAGSAEAGESPDAVEATAASDDPVTAAPTPAVDDATPAPGPAEATEPAADDAPPPEAPQDTFEPAVLAMTSDAEGRSADENGFDPATVTEFGFNPEPDDAQVWLPFVAQAGGQLLSDQTFALASPESAAAFRYLADLTEVHDAAADAQAYELFLDGRLALFQSSSAELRDVAQHAEFDWGVAPVAEGPQGAVAMVDGVAAAANADSDDMDATLQVLQWLASTDGQSALASQGVGLPAASGAQNLFTRSWADHGVDTGAVLEAATGPTVPAPRGSRVQLGLEAMAPLLTQMFRGELPVAEALPAAEETANHAATQP